MYGARRGLSALEVVSVVDSTTGGNPSYITDYLDVIGIRNTGGKGLANSIGVEHQGAKSSY